MGKLLHTRQVSAQMWRGPAPVDPSHFAQLKSLGIDTILNLERGWGEIWNGDDEYLVEMGNAVGARTIRVKNGVILPPLDHLVDSALEVMSFPSIYGNVYVHCKLGVDRTGYNVAAYRVLKEGWTIRAALQEMYDMGFHSNRYFWWVPHLEQYVYDRGVYL